MGLSKKQIENKYKNKFGNGICVRLERINNYNGNYHGWKAHLDFEEPQYDEDFQVYYTTTELTDGCTLEEIEISLDNYLDPISFWDIGYIEYYLNNKQLSTD